MGVSETVQIETLDFRGFEADLATNLAQAVSALGLGFLGQ